MSSRKLDSSRFFGKSSNAMLIYRAFQARAAYNDTQKSPKEASNPLGFRSVRQEFWSKRPVSFLCLLSSTAHPLFSPSPSGNPRSTQRRRLHTSFLPPTLSLLSHPSTLKGSTSSSHSSIDPLLNSILPQGITTTTMVSLPPFCWSVPLLQDTHSTRG